MENVANGHLLSIAGLSHFTAGLEEDEDGFTTILAEGGITFEDGAGGEGSSSCSGQGLDHGGGGGGRIY